jgi:C4-dicarboxylate transporter DctQ subunit
MRRINKTLDWIEEIVMAVGLFIMMVLNFLNAVCRFLLPQTPFSFTEELTLLLFMWITMFGISCAYKRNAHTGLSLLTDIFPPALKKISIIIASVCSLILMVVIFFSGYVMVQNQIKFGNIMPGLKISAAYGGLAMPITAVIMFFRILQGGIQKIVEQDKQGDRK